MAKGKRPRKKSLISQEDWDRAFEALNSESTERGVVIVADAILDAIVEEALRAKFAGDDTLHNELLNVNQPLGSAAARRKVARAIGLIGPEMYEAMSLLGKIRNAYAHWNERERLIDECIPRICELTHQTNSIAGLNVARKEKLMGAYLSLIGRLGIIRLEATRFNDGPKLPKPTIVRV
jgi:DNA-binding MltR family transcriptional regulator